MSLHGFLLCHHVSCRPAGWWDGLLLYANYDHNNHSTTNNNNHSINNKWQALKVIFYDLLNMRYYLINWEAVNMLTKLSHCDLAKIFKFEAFDISLFCKCFDASMGRGKKNLQSLEDTQIKYISQRYTKGLPPEPNCLFF